MPFFAALFAAVQAIGAITIAGTTVGAIVGNLAIGLALTYLGRPRPSATTVDGQAVLNQSIGKRQRGYGLCLLGGTRAVWDEYDRSLWQIIVMHHGRVNKFRRLLINGEKVDLDDQGRVTQEQFIRGDNFYVQVWQKSGRDGQTALQPLIDVSGGYWTDQHRLRGLAYIAVKMLPAKNIRFAKIFPKSHNTVFQQIVETSLLYDPRTGQTVYSANSALAIWDYLSSPDGFPGVAADDLDVSSFKAFANLCDERVHRGDGVYEPRYETHGLYQLDEEAKTVLDRLTATCDAELYLTSEGKIGIRGGEWTGYSYILREDDILGNALVEGTDAFSGYNQLRVMYTDPGQGFQATEAQVLNDIESQARNGVSKEELPLDMVASPTQARRLAKIRIARDNPKWSGTVTANINAVDALSQRVIRIQISELGINDTFFVRSAELAGDLSSITFSVQSMDRSAYAWDATEDGDTQPELPETPPSLAIPVPQNPVATFDSKDRVKLVVDDPDAEELDLDAQYKEAGGDYEQMTTTDYTARSVAVDTGETYTVRARFLTATGTAGEWADPTTTP